MNVYRCIGADYEHYMGWEEPPEPGRDVAIVAADNRGQARYIFWREYGDGELLTEFRAEIRKTGEVPFAKPKIVEYPQDGAFWMTPKELRECASTQSEPL